MLGDKEASRGTYSWRIKQNYSSVNHATSQQPCPKITKQPVRTLTYTQTDKWYCYLERRVQSLSISSITSPCRNVTSQSRQFIFTFNWMDLFTTSGFQGASEPSCARARLTSPRRASPYSKVTDLICLHKSAHPRLLTLVTSCGKGYAQVRNQRALSPSCIRHVSVPSRQGFCGRN